jgi:hypothetical protein
MPRLRVFAACTAGLFRLVTAAQQNDVPLNRDVYAGIDRNGALAGSTMHTGLRPLIRSRAELDGVLGYATDSSRQYYWITAKLLKEHLVKVSDGDFTLTVDPVFNFEAGKEFREGTDYAEEHILQHNGRGFLVQADLGPTVSFQSTFYENQATLSGYLYDYAQVHGVVPGQGRIKTFNERGLDFAWAAGNVSWTPRPWINAQLGQGRQFVGNGWRSMLLSDNTAPYPFLKLSALTPDKRLQYTVTYAKLRMVGVENRLPTGEAGESLFGWKRATFTHASINLGPLQLGLFEGTQWQAVDSSGVRPFIAEQINPLIGLNTLLNSSGVESNTLTGLDVKLRMAGQWILYGQFALSGQEGEYAWQLGAQWFDRGPLGLHLLVEFDQATPRAYTGADAEMSWSNVNQPLASPLGTGFSEALLVAELPVARRFRAQVELSMAQWAAATDQGNGGRYLLPGGLDSIPPGGSQRAWADASLSWRMNPVTNMELAVGYRCRDLTPAPGLLNSGYLYATFRMGMFNRWYDL